MRETIEEALHPVLSQVNPTNNWGAAFPSAPPWSLDPTVRLPSGSHVPGWVAEEGLCSASAPVSAHLRELNPMLVPVDEQSEDTVLRDHSRLQG